MTATLTTTREQNPYAIPAWYGWPGFIVATWQLAEFIEANKPKWQAMYSPTNKGEYMPTHTDNEDGWKTVIAMNVGQIIGRTEEAISRRIYGVMAGEAKIVRAEFADAVCLSLGMFIHHDTDLTVLPGCRAAAVELIEERATFEKRKLRPETVNDYARRLLYLSCKIVENPEQHDKLVAKAPLDALRDYR